ncbi:MAG: hypothetical protein Q4D41_00295 [Prevotellaceae bacterium]|nr:hypothetical protein [Prevotellaceae bacterium]
MRLTIRTDSIKHLPDGASYSASNGRANVSVSRSPDAESVVVYASCDSLQQLVWRYEQELSRIRSGTSESSQTEEVRTEEERCSWPVRIIIIAFFAGATTGAIVTSFIIDRTRQNKQS